MSLTYTMSPVAKALDEVILRVCEMTQSALSEPTPSNVTKARALAEVTEILMRARRQA